MTYFLFVFFFFYFCNMKKTELNRRIGRRIVDLREKKGWMQADLARACKKDRQALEKVENGKVNSTIYTLYEISKALDVSLTSIVDV